MRVYFRNSDSLYEHPEDMRIILQYLRSHGTLIVSGKVVEQLYYEFSEKLYNEAWTPVNGEMLDHFADWMNEKEL